MRYQLMHIRMANFFCKRLTIQNIGQDFEERGSDPLESSLLDSYKVKHTLTIRVWKNMPIRKLYTGVQCNTIHYSQKLEKNYPLVNKNESLLIQAATWMVYGTIHIVWFCLGGIQERQICCDSEQVSSCLGLGLRRYWSQRSTWDLGSDRNVRNLDEKEDYIVYIFVKSYQILP